MRIGDKVRVIHITEDIVKKYYPFTNVSISDFTGISGNTCFIREIREIRSDDWIDLNVTKIISLENKNKKLLCKWMIPDNFIQLSFFDDELFEV